MAKYIQTSGLKEKTYPNVGDKLYLRQFTGNYYVDIVKRPYTVIEVNKTTVKVQECDLIFNGPRYYDTLPDKIIEDKTGRVEELTWHSKRKMWGTKGRESDYPEYAIFGEWKFFPYLN